MQLKLDCIISLDLSVKTPYKKKKSIIDFLTSNGATISFILNKKSKYLVIDDKSNIETYKCRTAFKLKIPIIHIDYFYKSILDGNQELKVKDFIIKDQSIENNFKKGKIYTDNNEKKITNRFNLSKFKSFSADNDPLSCEFESSGYQLLKWIVFHETSGTSHVIFEIHTNNKQFRLRIEHIKKSDRTVKTYYTSEGPEAQELFEHLAKSWIDRFHYDQILPKDSGSLLLQSNYFTSMVNSKQVSDDLANFLNYIWTESVGELDTIFKLNDKNFGLTNSMLDKAELILYNQRDEFVKPREERTNLTKSYFSSLPFRHSYEKKSLLNKKNLNDQFELMQVLRDMLNIAEETNWNPRTSVQSIYRSIGCHISSLSNQEFSTISEQIKMSSEFDSSLEILNIYAVNRPNEVLNFNKNIKNVQLLYHGSKVSNFVGILSRGLLTPKNILSPDTPDGPDPLEMLGFGIYFSDSFKTSVKYSKASNHKHTHLVLICEVALGKCKELYECSYNLSEAPQGYDSVHGVKKTADNGSVFEDSEYCVYRPDQCKIKYLVEVKPVSVSIPNIDYLLSNEKSEQCEPVVDKIDLTEPKFMEAQTALKTSDGKNLPLKSVHVRAQIIDMVSKVTIYQEYENNENRPIEAEYLFPLVDTAAVCNFEAFINDKHVIGVCKRKEVARKEYREAIRQGKGAYLIDQETNEIFKVNVGNLPSKAKCVIKITYVSEMDIQNEQIYFRLPSNICQWKAFEERENLQDSVVSRHINRMSAVKKSSFKACVLMPFEIRSIQSYTHAIKIKKTACQAVLEMEKKLEDNEDDSLIIAIQIATIHMPRMFVEEHFDREENKTSRACMVSFYPEFGDDDRLAKQEKPVINFILDCSNSLSDNNLIRLSKKLILLMLNYMPKDSTFNVTIFGTDYHNLFPYPLANTSQTVKQASQFILEQATANKGNTDLLNFIQKEDPLYRSQNYVLISDGHMTRPNELIAYLAEHSKRRIFTCSIGNLTNNNHLLKSIANLTKSHFNFYDEKNQSKWREKIEDLMDKIEQPAALSDIRIEWQNFDQTNFDQETFDHNYAPKQINCLFNGRRVLAYGFMPNCQQALLRASINGYKFETVVTCPELMITKGDLIHKLTAKALIDDWQHGILCSHDKIQNDLLKQKLKDKIIKLSQKFSIISDYTSFIAIEDRDPNESMGEQIEVNDLLKKDDVSIDLLPYMAYQECLIQKEDMPLDDITLTDQIRLFDFYSHNEDLISSNKMKIFMANEYRKRSMIDKAIKCYELCQKSAEIDQAIDELRNFRPEIYVKTLTGRTISVLLNEIKTVDDLKNVIQEKEGIPLEQQTLVALARPLGKGLLYDYGITDNTIVHLVLRLRGGPIEIKNHDVMANLKRKSRSRSRSIDTESSEDYSIPEKCSYGSSEYELQASYLRIKSRSRSRSIDTESSEDYSIPEKCSYGSSEYELQASYLRIKSRSRSRSIDTESSEDYSIPEKCSYGSSEDESKAFDADDFDEDDDLLSIGVFDSIEANADFNESREIKNLAEIQQMAKPEMRAKNSTSTDSFSFGSQTKHSKPLFPPAPPPKFSKSNFNESSVNLDLGLECMENLKEIETNKTDKKIKLGMYGAALNQSGAGFDYFSSRPGGSGFSPMQQQYSKANSFSFGSQAKGYNRGKALFNPPQSKPLEFSKSNINEEKSEQEDEEVFDFSEGSSSRINIMPLGSGKIIDKSLTNLNRIDSRLVSNRRSSSILSDRKEKIRSRTSETKKTDLDSSESNKIIKVVDTKSLREFLKVNVFELAPNLSAFDKIEISNFKIKIKECEIDCMPLMNFLVSMGLNSFGEQVADEIKELVIHLIIMVLIVTVFSTDKIQIMSFQQLNETIEKIVQPSYTGYGFVEHVRSFCQRAHFLQLKYPDVCDSLELGRNWDKVVENLFLIDSH